MTIQRMDNVGIVVEDLDAAIAFFTALGMELEGRLPIQGRWAEPSFARRVALAPSLAPSSKNPPGSLEPGRDARGHPTIRQGFTRNRFVGRDSRLRAG
nr:hypothetical protein [Actinospica robiniae]